MDKKQQTILRMLKYIREYTDSFNEPCPMRVVSQQYSKAFSALGGLPEIISELIRSGEIRVWLNRNGAKAVTLPDSQLVMGEGVVL